MFTVYPCSGLLLSGLHTVYDMHLFLSCYACEVIHIWLCSISLYGDFHYTSIEKKIIWKKKTFANVHVQNSAVLLGFVVKKQNNNFKINTSVVAVA